MLLIDIIFLNVSICLELSYKVNLELWYNNIFAKKNNVHKTYVNNLVEKSA